MDQNKYVELVAAIAIQKHLAPQLDLLVGWHPYEHRHLTEEEEQILPTLQFLDMESLEQTHRENTHYKNIFLWLDHFPNIRRLGGTDIEQIYRSLWLSTLEHADILHLAYAFYPWGTLDINLLEKYRAVKDASQKIQSYIDSAIENDPRMSGKIAWCFPFPYRGALGKVVEEKAGLSIDIKERLGLINYDPGFLCNYLLIQEKSIEEILNPYQFEELVASLFKEEGWEVEVTRKSRDGGKDIIAKRTKSGIPTVAYIEGKRYKGSVGMSVVKEFTATVAADNVDIGYIFTTSYFSSDASNWSKKKGSQIATIELVDKAQLIDRIQKVANARVAAFLKI